MLNIKTIAFIFLVAIFATLVQVASCKLVVANGSQRLVVSSKRRIGYNKRDAATAGAAAVGGGLPTLPNIQLPNADTTALLASAGPLLSSVSSVKIPQLPALPGAASTAGSVPAAMVPQAAAPAPAAKKDEEDEEEEDEDED